MKKSIVWVAVVFVVVSVCASSGFAYDKEKGCCGKGGCGEKVVKKIYTALKYADALALTDEQKTEIGNLKYTLKKTLIMKNAEADVVALDIKQQLWSAEPDAALVKELVSKKYAVIEAEEQESVATYLKLKTILTDEQNQKMCELKKKCSPHAAHGKEHGQGACPSPKK